MKSDLVDFDVVLLAETPTAWKVRRVDDTAGRWVPKEDSELYAADAAGTRQLTTTRAAALRLGLRR